MAKGNILVTGIGGNVGQGIVRNVRTLPYALKIIGTNTTEFSSGNYLCDHFFKVPFAYDEDYISAIINIVSKQKVDLIIPSTDYEAYYLSLNRKDIPCLIAISDIQSTQIYLDKYKTYLHHKKNNIPFAETTKPSEYSNNFKQCIVKPAKGRGSRNLFFNPDNFSQFSDDEYVVQELHVGKEITTAFYVNRQNKLHGSITMLRTLENGTTNLCKVTSQYDSVIVPILEKMIAASGLAGSVNIQSIVDKDGTVIPFEVNCRISGTNSIRSNFGFKDVHYTLQEYLLNEVPDVPNITPGVAVRVLLDVIYPGQTDFIGLKDNSSTHYIF